MEIFSEARAEDFLEKAGFPVVERGRAETIRELREAIDKSGTPFVMKVSGAKIFDKKGVRGIKMQMHTFTQTVYEFKDLKKIPKSNGAIVQKKMEGKEFIAGIKKTIEFGHSVYFGNIKENFVFRVTPLDKEETGKMIKESAAFLPKEDDEAVSFILEKLSDLTEKHPEISEAEIRFVIPWDKNVKIIDARIHFE